MARRGAVSAGLLLVVAVGCTDGEAPNGALTRQEIESRSGIDLPASTQGFRATRIAATELQFTATVDDPDGAALRDALRLEAGRRVITHSSPLWDLNPDGPVAGGSSALGDVRRTVELVDDPAGRSTLRVVLDGV